MPIVSGKAADGLARPVWQVVRGLGPRRLDHETRNKKHKQSKSRLCAVSPSRMGRGCVRPGSRLSLARHATICSWYLALAWRPAPQPSMWPSVTGWANTCSDLLVLQMVDSLVTSCQRQTSKFSASSHVPCTQCFVLPSWPSHRFLRYSEPRTQPPQSITSAPKGSQGLTKSRMSSQRAVWRGRGRGAPAITPGETASWSVIRVILPRKAPGQVTRRGCSGLPGNSPVSPIGFHTVWC